MKLTRGKLLETIRRKNEGWTSYQARKIACISVRRVNQVYSHYLKTGVLPEIGKRSGRPENPFSEDEKKIVEETYKVYRVSAATLEKVIERDYYGLHIPHNKIHKIMLLLGLAKAKKEKDVRKKDWIRYERRHSLSAVHIDWYYDPVANKWVFAIIDDASRYLLALLEVDSPTTDASIEGMLIALKHGKIRECISDHGTQFIKQEGMKSGFADFLKEEGIKQILCKIKHPQSNGKVEKFFDLYKNHRHAFNSEKEFMHWYNNIRPHRSLRFDELETPHQAFIRKRKAVEEAL
jgi:putative transposase